MPTQTIWITGASSGIGEALAVRFARDGARLVLSARRDSELERVAARCREEGLSAEQVLVLPLDVTDWEGLSDAVQRVLDTFGSIDLLVNNAGVSFVMQRYRYVGLSETDGRGRDGPDRSYQSRTAAHAGAW